MSGAGGTVDVSRTLDKEMRVFGALLTGYAQACINLNIVAGRRSEALLDDLEINRWYPLDRWLKFERVVLASYAHAGPIMERVGMQMMLGWYHHGPGKALVAAGPDFLEFQTGSGGYASVVDGPESSIGAFALLENDRARGHAQVRSTTPFNREMERGVLIGGMKAPGDLDFVDVVYRPDAQIFDIEYH